MHEIQNCCTVIKRIIFIFVSIFIFFQSGYASQIEHSGIQPIQKIYLQKNSDDSYSFCIDFVDGAVFSPRIHTLPNGVKLILSFQRNVQTPKAREMLNHRLIYGYFFEQIGTSSLLMILSLREKVIFTEKRYTSNSIKLTFKIKKKHNIVIDAGHGGKDPGTKCLSGDYEKNIALVTAIELRNELIASGRYNVILTRDRDKFVSINERKALAAGADLLISLHTDSNSDKNMRGMSVYTLPILNFIKTKDNLPEETENNQYYKILSQSRRFANILVSYIPNMCKFRNHPRRDVELRILKLPFPAVLIELGCVSNKIDNELLHSKDFREKTNRAILYALDKYFEKE